MTKDEEVEKFSRRSSKNGAASTFLIHAIAFANKEDLANPYVQTSRAGFHLAMDVSAYSLVALTRHAAPLMEGRNGAMSDADLHGFGESHSQLQCHGRRQSRVGSERALSGP